MAELSAREGNLEIRCGNDKSITLVLSGRLPAITLYYSDWSSMSSVPEEVDYFFFFFTKFHSLPLDILYLRHSIPPPLHLTSKLWLHKEAEPREDIIPSPS